MKKYLKKISIFMVLLVSFMGIISCGKKTSNDDVDFALSDFTNKIGSDLEGLKEGTEDDLKNIYDISKDDVEDFKLYISPDGTLDDDMNNLHDNDKKIKQIENIINFLIVNL